ncbi:MAG: alpha-glucan family phosphorylase, partial [Peptococcaceae bacterium]|nr:alpha-glucan family phosphorylase [Peptococcaceae bacterium]
ALRAMGINPRVWHINEGHAAFLIIERIRELMRYGVSFDTAREVVRASTIFTTHTPVPAGHDLFSEEMIGNFFIPIITEMGVNFKDFKDLGWDEERNSFNMTLLALRHSCLANGVSRLHGRVAREMFRSYYKGLHPGEVPVTSITNGVHVETWLAWELREMFNRCLGKGWVDRIAQRETWERVEQIRDEELWKTHRLLKDKMIAYVRTCIKQQRSRNREPAQRISEVDEYLNPDILTIGFARRFATYKRANLLFRDRERLSRLVNHPERPVRFIFAGKAHPADIAGQELIRQIYEVSSEPEFRGKVLLLENYDIHMARHLLQGVDVWLNTPRRPMEASGTSGQKAALNGVINVSTLDGWWPEAYNGENGFAVGSESAYQNDELQDRDDWYSLFSVLEDRLVPMYYRKEGGLPREWIRMMKDSIKSIAPVFNTHRMVAEYAERFYIPAARRGSCFSDNNNAVAGRASAFKKFIGENWGQVHFVTVESNGRPTMHVGERLEVSAVLNLGPVYPRSVAVEVVYGDAGDSGLRNISVAPMSMAEEVAPGVYRFAGNLVLPQGALGYTVRVRPHCQYFPHAELPLVTWAPDL